MAEQPRESAMSAALQAGPVEVDGRTTSDITTREARVIGRQLALIGDELNRRWTYSLADQWRRPMPIQWPWDWRANVFIAARLFRRVYVAERGWPGQGFALGKLWLNPLVYNLFTWVSSVSPAGLGCSAGVLLSTALLATAAVCIALWELKKD